MTLAAQQAALVAALWQPRLGDAMDSIAGRVGGERAAGRNGLQRGLQAYRSNAAALAPRALAAAYPVVAALVGEETFTGLARLCWQRHPPRRGDLAQWGAELPPLVESLADLAQAEPYLADVARVEWLLHQAAQAPDAQPNTASLALLAQDDPAHLRLQLAPGTAVQASPHPVASIVNAHLEGEPALDIAGERLRAGRAETAVVWRQGLRTRVREALPGEAALLAALATRAPLLAAVEHAGPALDIGAWLATAIPSGLLLGAARIPSTPS